ncbi:xaa-Arg dipeptidase-like [Hydractinia symbiolongicarpus]|uniref:xaa-Arg dipeptidase-like n=1 Tax=Hydractinia symbiolongicarpus TaxID=13093 RepID=UPI00254BDA61|nr:xaa-Arg dipeptidase-like [Hydractinia symbiolongicarpus]XP_057313985.1 xaa-Arg dipeptidase-like [Hydractinia symbiolongicarpus]XP_057313986.1 xaa-Arg dipeptidase-like [Hydractinia symbiolongicarpus]XP_057313987.1 xaa-Arg dipeptidase-like [Hydractinia symbiolongicarpus]
MEAQLKEIACKEIDHRASDLNNISQEIWKNPELSFKEHAAHELLTTFLEKEGFNVSKKTPLETSFIARYGSSEGLKIGILCEYDALPGVGHACGHNLIAEAGIGAALGLKAAVALFPEYKFEIIVYGTPAEEADRGKVKMLQEGVFKDVDFCMISHPTTYEIPVPMWLAVSELQVIFKGKASHAAAAPWEGINALDAAVACYNNVSMLRQQMKPTSRVHCTIVKGGDKPNIIPEYAEMWYNIRGKTDSDLLALQEKVIQCVKGAAASTGCSVVIPDQESFLSSIKTNKPLIDSYIINAKSLGVKFDADNASKVLASSDMGNVSQVKPSIHPLFKIQTNGPIHTHEFRQAAGDVINQLPTLNSSKSMAMTAIDVICKPELMQDIKKSFSENV